MLFLYKPLSGRKWGFSTKSGDDIDPHDNFNSDCDYTKYLRQSMQKQLFASDKKHLGNHEYTKTLVSLSSNYMRMESMKPYSKSNESFLC